MQENQPKKPYETKPLEGVIWGEERLVKTNDGREFTVMKGSLKDENGKEFYIDAYVNYSSDGSKRLGLKLKSVEEVKRAKAERQGEVYQPQQDNNRTASKEIRLEDIPF